MNFVVLSSSGGTTFQAVMDRIADGTLTARCLGLVTDRADRGCAEKARKAELPVQVVERNKGETREAYDRRLSTGILELTCLHPTPYSLHPLLACIGWMWLLSPWFVRTWCGRILNVHPALLPLHPGCHPHKEVLAAREKESGMTIHWVDEGVDTGPIIVQKKCSVFADDTVNSLKSRVQELEKEWYPKVLQMIEDGRLKVKAKFPLPAGEG
ncbi:phosphoribosylglycinamide formyltransferase [Candidatus Peregrinibacteria bacterium]|nr:phosphoribosylglycinamide formyltransferase [Candidatus Peregrinibacteria bacterium]